MLKCPKCGATLPSWATTCQFCGTSVANVPRAAPTVLPDDPVPYRPNQAFVTLVYNAVSVWYVVDGLRLVVTALKAKPGELGSFVAVLWVVALVNIVIGMGLLLRVELVRNIVVFFASLNLLLGILGLAGSLFGTLVLGGIGFLMVVFGLIGIVMNALMIFLVGETETRAPNT